MQPPAAVANMDRIARLLDLVREVGPAYLHAEVESCRRDLTAVARWLALPPRIVFRPLGDIAAGRWLVGREGQEQPYQSTQVGLVAGFLCLAGQSVICADLTRCANPDKVIREAVRATAANWIEAHTGCVALASAFRAMRVVDGRLQHQARNTGPVFLLSSSTYASADHATTIDASQP